MGYTVQTNPLEIRKQGCKTEQILDLVVFLIPKITAINDDNLKNPQTNILQQNFKLPFITQKK